MRRWKEMHYLWQINMYLETFCTNIKILSLKNFRAFIHIHDGIAKDVLNW